MSNNAGTPRPDQLFPTADLNPLSPDYRPETVVPDQGGSVRAVLGDIKPGGAYLKAALGEVGSAPPAEHEEKPWERIKRDYPLELFAQQHPQRLGRGKKHGPHTIKYVCPWHADDEKSPNLEVYLPGHKDYGYCRCRRCDGPGKPASVIDLAMAVYGTSSVYEAMRLIEGKSAYDAPRRQAYVASAKRFSEVVRPEINAPEHVHNFALQAAVRLETDAQVIRYLTSRGLGGAMKLFHLGSSFNLPHGALPQKLGEDNRVIPHRNFLGRLVIPYLTPDGIVSTVNARALDDVRLPKYLKPSTVGHQPYHLDCALKESGGDIVLCEGELDAISLMLALGNNGTGVFAVPGIHCFPETEAPKLDGRRVFIVTDNDGAGNEGREKLAEMIYGYARSVQHIEVKAGFKDVNRMLSAEGRRYVRGWFDACLQGAVRVARRRVWFV